MGYSQQHSNAPLPPQSIPSPAPMLAKADPSPPCPQVHVSRNVMWIPWIFYCACAAGVAWEKSCLCFFSTIGTENIPTLRHYHRIITVYYCHQTVISLVFMLYSGASEKVNPAKPKHNLSMWNAMSDVPLFDYVHASFYDLAFASYLSLVFLPWNAKIG